MEEVTQLIVVSKIMALLFFKTDILLVLHWLINKNKQQDQQNH